MAKRSGLGQNLYVGGYDLSGDVGAVRRAGSPRALLEATGIDKSARERVVGPSDGRLAFIAWFNDAADQEHDALKGLPTADRVLLYAMGTSLSDPAAGLVAKQIGYDWRRGPDGSLRGAVAAVAASSPLEWGKMLTAGKVTHASAASETGEVDAQTAAGLIGFLQAFSIGSGTPAFVIEHSSDTTDGTDGAWSALLAFDAASAPTGERKTVTGTVEKGLRARTTGTFTDAVFAVAFRRGAPQDDIDLS
jgi:hypothetical protein